MKRNGYGEDYCEKYYKPYCRDKYQECPEHEEDCDDNLIIILLIIIIILLQGLQPDAQAINATSLIKDSGKLLDTIKELL
jgi:hypothetical protein